MTYDDDGLMTSAGAMKLVYDPNSGLLTSDTVGNVITTYTYSGFGELASKETKFNSTLLLKLEFVRDSLGRITLKTETDQTDTTKNNYEYDAQGRLSKVWRNDTLTATYSYDQNGNRLAKITPTATDSGTYDSQDRMLTYGGAEYFYSEYGDLQMKVEGSDSTMYVYDAFGSLVSVSMPDGTKIEYLLDGNGLRVGRKVNGVITQKWLYSGKLRISAQLDSIDNVESRFIYAMSENVPQYMEVDDSLFRLVSDHLGTLHRVVNVQSGTILQTVKRDEYGIVIDEANSEITPFGFASGHADSLTSLMRFGTRDYAPSSGRWLSKDRIGFEGGGSNLFEYVASSPQEHVDPTGQSLDVFVSIVLAIYSLSQFEVEEASVQATTAAAGLLAAGPITGYTKHGIKQAIARDGVGVATKAILEAVKHPVKIVAQTGGRLKYIGGNAVVILNKAGKVVTTWAKNRSAWRMFK